VAPFPLFATEWVWHQGHGIFDHHLLMPRL
jgi:hypothetical protein